MARAALALLAALVLPQEAELFSLLSPPAQTSLPRQALSSYLPFAPHQLHETSLPRVRREIGTRVRLLNADSVFVANNLLSLPLWSLMILFPKSRKTQTVMSSLAIFLPFILLYVLCVLGSVVKPEIQVAAASFSSLSGLTALFSHQPVVASSWSHHICFDLFVGRWIFFDAVRNRVPATISLLATMFLGPVGLALHLVTRILLSKNTPKDSLTDGITDSLSDENLLRMVDEN
eukprot:766632-Hanusia_phi.AAC.2